MPASAAPPALPGADDPQLRARQAEVDAIRQLPHLKALLDFADRRQTTQITIREVWGEHELLRSFASKGNWRDDTRIAAHLEPSRAGDASIEGTVYATASGSVGRDGGSYGYSVTYVQVGEGWELLEYRDWLLGSVLQ